MKNPLAVMAQWFLRSAQYLFKLSGNTKELKAGSILIISTFNLSSKEVFKIRLFFEDGSSSEHLVALEHITRFLTATRRLHYCPGINPHSKGICSKVEKIRIWKLRHTGPYWWTEPHLQQNYSAGGAVLLEWSFWREINMQELEIPADWSSFEKFGIQKPCLEAGAI